MSFWKMYVCHSVPKYATTDISKRLAKVAQWMKQAQTDIATNEDKLISYDLQSLS